MRITFRAALLLALGLTLNLAVTAPQARAQQAQFAPRLLIDDKVITNYEYDQRLRFMTLLNAPGDLRQEAERTLVEDRLRQIAADRMRIRLSDAQITAGMTEFAARFEMELEQLLTILESNGIAPQTYRDFVQNGLVWREVVRARFAPGAPASVTEADIDRRLSLLQQRTTARILLSEIVLAPNRGVLADEISETVRSEAAFAAYAREHSKADTSVDGGRVGWLAVTSLSSASLSVLDGLQRGQVSRPVVTEKGIEVYFVRDIQLLDRIPPALSTVDYAELTLPAAGSPETEARLAAIRARVLSCDDFWAFARGLPQEQFQRQQVALGALPRDVAGVIETLDENEFSTALRRGGAQVVVMLCSRRVASDRPANRDTIRTRIADERLAIQADIYLQELRTNAHIRKP